MAKAKLESKIILSPEEKRTLDYANLPMFNKMSMEDTLKQILTVAPKENGSLGLIHLVIASRIMIIQATGGKVYNEHK